MVFGGGGGAQMEDIVLAVVLKVLRGRRGENETEIGRTRAFLRGFISFTARLHILIFVPTEAGRPPHPS